MESGTTGVLNNGKATLIPANPVQGATGKGATTPAGKPDAATRAGRARGGKDAPSQGAIDAARLQVLAENVVGTLQTFGKVSTPHNARAYADAVDAITTAEFGAGVTINVDGTNYNADRFLGAITRTAPTRSSLIKSLGAAYKARNK